MPKKELSEKSFGKTNFAVLQLQVAVVLMLLALFFQDIVGVEFVAGVELILSVYFFFVLFMARKDFLGEWKLLALFFCVIYAIIQAYWISRYFVRGAEERINIAFFLLLALFAFVIFFRVLLGRGFVFGKVLSSDGRITVVETFFDVRTFSKGGRHVIETEKNFREGKKVKLKVKNAFFGMKIDSIID
ncbi:MAG: DUF2101 family protein [Candidatus Diapherotrites archaeon]